MPESMDECVSIKPVESLPPMNSDASVIGEGGELVEYKIP